MCRDSYSQRLGLPHIVDRCVGVPVWSLGFSHPLEYLSAVGTSPAGCGMTAFAVMALYCEIFVGISFSPHISLYGGDLHKGRRYRSWHDMSWLCDCISDICSI